MRRIEGSHAIGQLIKDARHGKGLTLAELARRTNVSPAHLSQIENEKVTNPGVEVLSRIATALGITFDIAGHRPTGEHQAGLSYASPFSLEQLAQTSSEVELIKTVEELLRDKRLSRAQKENICGKVLSYARWLIGDAVSSESKAQRGDTHEKRR